MVPVSFAGFSPSWQVHCVHPFGRAGLLFSRQFSKLGVSEPLTLVRRFRLSRALKTERSGQNSRSDASQAAVVAEDAPHCSRDTLGSCLYEEAQESPVHDGFMTASDARDFAEKNSVALPADLQWSADSVRYSFLEGYIKLQSSAAPKWLLLIPFVRNRMIYDDKFLFKVFVEAVVDATTCMIAEIYKRGEEFSSELPYVGTDLVIGTFVTTTLVMLMAPQVLPGKDPVNQNGLQQFLARAPSAAFKASEPGVCEYSVADRCACVVIKFFEYSLAGIACGFVGQSAANWIHDLYHTGGAALVGEVGKHTIAPPTDTALVTGLFMGVSSNLRYQVVFGLERLVDARIATSVPQAAYIATIVIRFINNVLGSANYIDFLEFFHVQS